MEGKGTGRGVRSIVALALAWCAACCLVASALALPEGRVYEMVSPPYKGGYGVFSIGAAAPSGEAVAFGSLGAFEGASSGETAAVGYVARRGPSGWSTFPVVPPATIAPGIVSHDFSATLESVLVQAELGPSKGAATYANTTRQAFLVHRTDAPDTVANWSVVGQVLQDTEETSFGPSYAGASSDFSHVLVNSELPLLEQAQKEEVYELLAGAQGGQSLRLVALNDEGGLINSRCRAGLGGTGSGHARSGSSVAAGGRELFFSVSVRAGGSGACPDDHSRQLFVRLDGARTLEVSKPLSAACPEGPGVPCSGAGTRPPAVFVGANEAGTRVFFTTTASLLPEDTDEQNDLYMATIGCPGGEAESCGVADRVVTSLVQVSHDPIAKQAAEVQDVVRVAPDGSRVYFVARGVLSGGANAEGHEPRKGADNLYVYDAVSGRVAFVADLCSGPGLSGPLQEGPVEDPQCPLDVEGSEAEPARNDRERWSKGTEVGTTPDGRFLVFSSYARLVGSDTDEAKDVYRYDAVAGTLARVSVGERGYDADGNCNDRAGESNCDATILASDIGIADAVAAQHEMATLAMSEDGSRIVFMTPEPLSPAAINGLANAYEWRETPGSSEGVVSLVSSGSAETRVDEAVITPSGGDIFFVTSQGLVAQDTDGANDVYDAHIGGGFPSAPVPRQPCSGDACQGPLTNPAPLLVPASAVQTPGENVAPASKPKKKVKAKKRARTGKRSRRNRR
jgi:hypothetical protein